MSQGQRVDPADSVPACASLPHPQWLDIPRRNGQVCSHQPRSVHTGAFMQLTTSLCCSVPVSTNHLVLLRTRDNICHVVQRPLRVLSIDAITKLWFCVRCVTWRELCTHTFEWHMCRWGRHPLDTAKSGCRVRFVPRILLLYVYHRACLACDITGGVQYFLLYSDHQGYVWGAADRCVVAECVSARVECAVHCARQWPCNADVAFHGAVRSYRGHMCIGPRIRALDSLGLATGHICTLQPPHKGTRGCIQTRLCAI